MMPSYLPQLMAKGSVDGVLLPVDPLRQMFCSRNLDTSADRCEENGYQPEALVAYEYHLLPLLFTLATVSPRFSILQCCISPGVARVLPSIDGLVVCWHAATDLDGRPLPARRISFIISRAPFLFKNVVGSILVPARPASGIWSVVVLVLLSCSVAQLLRAAWDVVNSLLQFMIL